MLQSDWGSEEWVVRRPLGGADMWADTWKEKRSSHGKTKGDAFQAEGMSLACPGSLINCWRTEKVSVLHKVAQPVNSSRTRLKFISLGSQASALPMQALFLLYETSAPQGQGGTSPELPTSQSSLHPSQGPLVHCSSSQGSCSPAPALLSRGKRDKARAERKHSGQVVPAINC